MQQSQSGPGKKIINEKRNKVITMSIKQETSPTKNRPSWGCVDIGELADNLFFLERKWSETSCGPKAKVDRFFIPGTGFFPDKLVILRSILAIDNTEGIEKNLFEGLSQGASMGVRSISDRPIFSGAKLDWDLEIDSPEKVRIFLDKTLPKWKNNARANNYKISQLIIMNNPPEIGTKDEHANQFVLRARWDSFNLLNNLGSQLLVEMTIGTNRLRELDKRMEKGEGDIIRYQCLYRQTGFLEQTELQVGSSYVENTSSEPNRNFITSKPISSLDLSKINLGDARTIQSVLFQLDALIKDQTIRLLKRLDFFASIGLNIVEFQGYIDSKTGLRKMFIYGLRGRCDETMTGLHS